MDNCVTASDSLILCARGTADGYLKISMLTEFVKAGHSFESFGKRTGNSRRGVHGDPKTDLCFQY